ncbi:MAG: histidine phosphatase family protein [Sphaerochaetaceae bacterium]|nr:histidine phosphatase family protein [Sphaerochaetaceae bacterium]
MKVFITRHGRTNYNEQRLVCGISEAELTEEGKAQAIELSKKLKAEEAINNIRYIYSSPLKRARDTAGYIASMLNLEVIVDDRLHEVDFGTYEATSWDNEEFKKIKKEPFMKFPGGESTLDAAHRAYSFIDEIKKKNLDGNILIVCHGTFARILSTYFVSYSEKEYQETRWNNCELKVFKL